MKAATGAPGNEAAAAAEAVAVLGELACALQVVVARAVLDLQDQEFALGACTLGAPEVIGEAKVAPGQYLPVVAARIEVLRNCFDLFDAPLGKRIAFAAGLEVPVAAVFVHFQLRDVALLVAAGGIGVLGSRVLEVEGADGRVPGHEGACSTPLVDGIFFLCATFALEANVGRRPVHGFGQCGVVGENEGVALGRMFVPVAVAGGFPAPVQVVVVALALGTSALSGHGDGEVFAADLPLPLRQGVVVVEDRLGLLLQVLAVEQAVVRAQAQVPQPRTKPGFVEGKVAVGLDETEGEDDAGEVAQAAVRTHEIDAQHLALQILERQVGIAREQFGRVFEVARHAFAGV
ncbi:hypothetical protein D3C85_453560 [compost metagenome]